MLQSKTMMKHTHENYKKKKLLSREEKKINKNVNQKRLCRKACDSKCLKKKSSNKMSYPPAILRVWKVLVPKVFKSRQKIHLKRRNKLAAYWTSLDVVCLVKDQRAIPTNENPYKNQLQKKLMSTKISFQRRKSETTLIHFQTQFYNLTTIKFILSF